MVDLSNLFFYCYFAIMFGMRMWGIFEGKTLYAPLLILGFALWGVSVLLSKHSVLEYCVIALFVMLAGAVYYNTGEKGLLLYFTLMLGMKNISVKKLFKVGIVVGALGMVCLTFLSSFGVIEDVAYVQNRAVFGYIFRHTLGFPHVNTLSTSFVILSMMIMYIVGHNNKAIVWKTTLLLFLITMYLYVYTDSRTGVLGNVIFLTLNLIYTYKNRISILERIIVKAIVPVIWGISIGIPMLVSEDTLRDLLSVDRTLVFRFIIGKSILNHNPVTLFGTRLSNPEHPLYGIDIAQLYLFVQTGIVAFVIITTLWIMFLWDELKESKIEELVISVVLLVMGMTDPFLYNLSYKNIAFIFIGVVLYNKLGVLSLKMPGFMNKQIQLIRLGNQRISVNKVKTFWDEIKQNSKSNVKIFVVIAVTFFLGAIALYLFTPDPNYVLADNNAKEHKVIEELQGKTYTDEQIERIKDEGNIVLNYTDNKELMYLYYSDESIDHEGGFYTPNAGLVEKARRSISLFFWGIMIGYFGVYKFLVSAISTVFIRKYGNE